jgi:hypothetical protein
VGSWWVCTTQPKHQIVLLRSHLACTPSGPRAQQHHELRGLSNQCVSPGQRSCPAPGAICCCDVPLSKTQRFLLHPSPKPGLRHFWFGSHWGIQTLVAQPTCGKVVAHGKVGRGRSGRCSCSAGAVAFAAPAVHCCRWAGPSWESREAARACLSQS